MVVCLGRGAYLYMAQLMPLPLTNDYLLLQQIQVSFTFLVLAHPHSPRQGAITQVLLLFIVV